MTEVERSRNEFGMTRKRSRNEFGMTEEIPKQVRDDEKEIPKQACLVKILNQVQNDICGVRDDVFGIYGDEIL
jgi:hypothetical protein